MATSAVVGDKHTKDDRGVGLVDYVDNSSDSNQEEEEYIIPKKRARRDRKMNAVIVLMI